jgi:hypothetical protein
MQDDPLFGDVLQSWIGRTVHTPGGTRFSAVELEKSPPPALHRRPLLMERLIGNAVRRSKLTFAWTW